MEWGYEYLMDLMEEEISFDDLTAGDEVIIFSHGKCGFGKMNVLLSNGRKHITDELKMDWFDGEIYEGDKEYNGEYDTFYRRTADNEIYMMGILGKIK